MNDTNRDYFEGITEQLIGARKAEPWTPPANDAVMSWEQKRAPVVVFHVTDDDSFPEYPVKPDWMPDDEWNDYQAFIIASNMPDDELELTEQGLEIAGAYAPRCDY